MDSRGGAAHPIAAARGALDELRAPPSAFGALVDARDRTETQLTALREQVARVTLPERTTVVLFGSWGRAELAEDSDVDWALVVDDADLALECPTVLQATADLREVLQDFGKLPGRQGIFGGAFHGWRLVDHVGLADDENANLTRRMLVLLESVPVTAPEVHADLKRRILARYLSRHSRAHRPPRFLLNDIIRYWRTIAVDFEGKLAQDRREGRGEDKFVMRNAKLRTSRKLLYYSGLLPVLLCHYIKATDMEDFLVEQFDSLATDRVARSFLHLGAAEAGARTLGAYDSWVSLVSDAASRAHLEGLTDATREDDRTFAQVRRVGDAIDNGILSLLYETSLSPVAQRFLTS